MASCPKHGTGHGGARPGPRKPAYFYEAALYRLRGVLVLQIGGCAAEDETEANIGQALKIAQKQKGRALELRVAISLCRPQQARGMPRDGIRVLAPADHCFTERAGHLT